MLVRTVTAMLCSTALLAANAGFASADTLVADSGFRPNPNGFSFENYGGDAGHENLTGAEMQKLFGREVCANRAGRKCTLTPPAQQWMDTQNKSMNGGHCYGFSVLAEALFKKQFPAFGPGATFSYAIQGNSSLQRSIAYAFVYQTLDSILEKRITGTPNEVLNKLVAALNPSERETYTIGIFKRDGSGGHAITPFGVLDQGGGKFAVQVYDNNYPGETRLLSFDTNKNTWSYNAAINPSVPPELYEGDSSTQSIGLYPTTPGLGVQPCPFCQPGGTASAASHAQLDQIQMVGNDHDRADLLVETPHGVIGTRGGRLVDTVSGGFLQPVLAGDYSESQIPDIKVASRNLKIHVDGSRLRSPETEMLSDIGPGLDLAIKDLRLGPGQNDLLALHGGVQNFSFASAPRQQGSPVLRIGAHSTRTDYAISLKLVRFHPGATVHVRLNTARHIIAFHETGNRALGTFVLSAVMETRAGNRRLAALTVRLHGTEEAAYSYRPR